MSVPAPTRSLRQQIADAVSPFVGGLSAEAIDKYALGAARAVLEIPAIREAPRSDWLAITRSYNQVCDERDQARYDLAYFRLKVEVEARRLEIDFDDLATARLQ